MEDGYTYADIKFEDMVKYIEDNAPQDKAAFKKVALRTNKNGETRYNNAAAKHWFCEKYFPDLLPKKAKAPNKTEFLKNW